MLKFVIRKVLIEVPRWFVFSIIHDAVSIKRFEKSNESRILTFSQRLQSWAVKKKTKCSNIIMVKFAVIYFSIDDEPRTRAYIVTVPIKHTHFDVSNFKLVKPIRY